MAVLTWLVFMQQRSWRSAGTPCSAKDCEAACHDCGGFFVLVLRLMVHGELGFLKAPGSLYGFFAKVSVLCGLLVFKALASSSWRGLALMSSTPC